MRTSARSFWASMTWRSPSASTPKASAGRSRTTTKFRCSSSRTAVRSQTPTATSGGSVTAREAAISHTRSSPPREATSGGGFHEPNEGHAEVRQEHQREQQEAFGTHGRGTSRDEGARQRAEGGREQGGGGK